jgi:hypothetical protein
MAEEEKKHEEPQSKKRFDINLKLSKKDVAALILLIVFVILVSMPTYMSKDNCEVARPEYKCASFKDVMVENCVYWGNYSCDTRADVSLTQVEWYIQNMCKLQNQYHGSGMDCSNLKSACNQIVGNQTCPGI